MTVREVLRVSFRPFLERTKEARMNLLLRRKSKIYYFSLFALLQTCNHLCNFFLPSPLESLVRSIVQRRTFTLKVNSVTGIVFIFRDKIFVCLCLADRGRREFAHEDEDVNYGYINNWQKS